MDIKSFFEQYKFYVVGVLAAIIILIYIFINNISQPVDDISFDFETAEEPPPDEAILATETTTVFVEVKGAVHTPGVYELPVDARVKNVLDIAELSENAELMTVNQSLKLVDEMVIYIPYEGEIDLETFVPGIVDSANSSNSELVNLNTASISELTTLNGIGEKKAQAILTYREEQGLFGKLEELKNIPGIGDKTLENLEPYITIK